MVAQALRKQGAIGSLTLEHRILMGAMHLGIEGDRTQLDQLKAFYRERAKGGAALIVTGGVAVLPAGGGDHMFCLTEADHREQLKELATSVHDVGGKIALQLQHNGRYAASAETGMTSVAPSPIMSKVTKETPAELSYEGIQEIKNAFIDGVAFARSAGFDAVEIMGSEGYLLNEFHSPLTNQRTDAYGGNSRKRRKLPLEIVAGIRENVDDDYPVIYRMSGDDYMEGSTTRDETMVFARELDKHGADALNVGIGWHESPVPTVQASVPAAAFAHVVSDVRQNVSVPVIGANRIHTPEVAADMLDRQLMDFVAPARPWLADDAFALKAQTGDRDALNVCIACNQKCLDHTLGNPRPVGCLVNPRAGNEWDWHLQDKQHNQSSATRNMAVVGGGVAGLSAAKALAEHGHSVTLFEARAQLGGLFRLAAQIPGKDTFRETIRFYKTSLERLNVTIKLATEPDVQTLKQFDKVISATGVKPYIPETLKGTDLPHVTTYADILSGKVSPGKKIAIVGGGGIGCDVAHLIAAANDIPGNVKSFFDAYGFETHPSQRVDVTLISRSLKTGKGVGPTTRWVLKSELKRLGVNILKGTECYEIAKDGVWVHHDDEQQFIEADQVIICTGQTADRALFAALKHDVPTETVGGSFDASELDAARAIQQGYGLIYDRLEKETVTEN